MAANSLKSSKVKTGQLLRIQVAETDSAKAGKSRVTLNAQTYIVKRGDTLHSIAEKFDVAVADLKRWNKKYGSHIEPGNELTIKQSDEV
jgi:membrane-bound lytic murein transglycosylase D